MANEICILLYCNKLCICHLFCICCCYYMLIFFFFFFFFCIFYRVLNFCKSIFPEEFYFRSFYDFFTIAKNPKFSTNKVGVPVIILPPPLDGMLVHHKVPPNISSGLLDNMLILINIPWWRDEVFCPRTQHKGPTRL